MAEDMCIRCSEKGYRCVATCECDVKEPDYTVTCAPTEREDEAICEVKITPQRLKMILQPEGMITFKTHPILPGIEEAYTEPYTNNVHDVFYYLMQKDVARAREILQLTILNLEEIADPTYPLSRQCSENIKKFKSHFAIGNGAPTLLPADVYWRPTGKPAPNYWEKATARVWVEPKLTDPRLTSDIEPDVTIPGVFYDDIIPGVISNAKKLIDKYKEIQAYLHKPAAKGEWFDDIPRYHLHPESDDPSDNGATAWVWGSALMRRWSENNDGMHFQAAPHFGINETTLFDDNDTTPHPGNSDDYSIINEKHAKIYKVLAIECKKRDERAVIIIHEATHIVLGTGDKSYANKHKFYGLTTDERMNTAASLHRYTSLTVGAELPIFTERSLEKASLWERIWE